MSPEGKKWLNRGGLIAIGIGVVMTVVGGGETSAALATGTVIAQIVGAVAVLVREIFN